MYYTILSIKKMKERMIYYKIGFSFFFFFKHCESCELGQNIPGTRLCNPHTVGQPVEGAHTDNLILDDFVEF